MPKGHPLPKAIKYLCDFLDVQAADLSQHDPDTLHTWKTNRYVAATCITYIPFHLLLLLAFLTASLLFLLFFLLLSCLPSALTTLCTHGRPTGKAQQLSALLTPLYSSHLRSFLPVCAASVLAILFLYFFSRLSVFSYVVFTQSIPPPFSSLLPFPSTSTIAVLSSPSLLVPPVFP